MLNPHSLLADADAIEQMALKRPNAISFSKKNDIRPFEDTASLDFWASKNDASLFVIGQDTKKRPDGLTFVRMFDGRVLDMCEVGVTNFVSMADLKVQLSPILEIRVLYSDIPADLSDPQIYTWPQATDAFCFRSF